MSAPGRGYIVINEEVPKGGAWGLLFIVRERNLLTGLLSFEDISGWTWDLYVKTDPDDYEDDALIHVENTSVVLSSTGGVDQDTAYIPLTGAQTGTFTVGSDLWALVTTTVSSVTGVWAQGWLHVVEGLEGDNPE